MVYIYFVHFGILKFSMAYKIIISLFAINFLLILYSSSSFFIYTFKTSTITYRIYILSTSYWKQILITTLPTYNETSNYNTYLTI